jgi:long-chain acyl-CoA synthetase
MIRRLPMVRFSAATLPALLVATARRGPERTFLRFVEPAAPAGPTRDLTFGAFLEGVARAAALLRGAGVGPGDRVLLLADNSPEWQMVSLGAQLLRAEPAALFASLAAEPARAIAERVGPKVVFVSAAAQWEKLAPAAAALSRAGLSLVVSGGPAAELALPAGLRAAPDGALAPGAAALERAEVEALAAAVGREDPFLLLFTSGTTGRPKGVRLPQRAIVGAIEGGAAATARGADDLGLHFLPFGHVAGHDQFALALAQGHALAMIARRDDLERALALRPTYLFSVPLVYERIRSAVEAKLAALPAPARRLAHAALAAAARVRVDGSRRFADRALVPVADRLVGRAVRARLGGRVQGLFSGGAPAAPALFRFFEGLGLPLVELYGMSETAGLIASNLFAGPRREAAAGLVTPDHEVRLAPDGELLLKGPLLLSGFLEPEDGEHAYDADGFFRTGDLARFDAEGFLRIDGRKKHLLVLSTGKKLSPEPIEQALASEPPFEGAVLLGEGRPFVSAAVFVAQDELARLVAAGKDAAEELLPRARAALASFSEFEKPKRLLVIPGAPTDHPALLTPTLKVKRDALLASLGGAVSALYDPA